MVGLDAATTTTTVIVTSLGPCPICTLTDTNTVSCLVCRSATCLRCLRRILQFADASAAPPACPFCRALIARSLLLHLRHRFTLSSSSSRPALPSSSTRSHRRPRRSLCPLILRRTASFHLFTTSNPNQTSYAADRGEESQFVLPELRGFAYARDPRSLPYERNTILFTLEYESQVEGSEEGEGRSMGERLVGQLTLRGSEIQGTCEVEEASQVFRGIRAMTAEEAALFIDSLFGVFRGSVISNLPSLSL